MLTHRIQYSEEDYKSLSGSNINSGIGSMAYRKISNDTYKITNKNEGEEITG